MDPVLAIFAVLALGLTVHEAGHLAFAALGSISVQLVSIGIGPPLLRARFGKTEFELRAFPFAGFVAPATTTCASPGTSRSCSAARAAMRR